MWLVDFYGVRTTTFSGIRYREMSIARMAGTDGMHEFVQHCKL